MHRQHIHAQATSRGPSRALTAESFTIRARALAALEGHDDQMRRSRALLDRARALCARVPEAPLRAPLPPPSPRTLALVEAPPAADRCAIRGCTRAGVFRPCFFVELDDRRILVRDVPLKLCVDHRGDVAEVFGRESVAAALWEKLRVGGGGPGFVRVLFEVTG